MSNKKHKPQDHIPIQSLSGEFIAAGYPGFLRKLSKSNRGYFKRSPDMQVAFVLLYPATPQNYPELIGFLKDNNVNTASQINHINRESSLNTATSTSVGSSLFMNVDIPANAEWQPKEGSATERLIARIDKRIDEKIAAVVSDTNNTDTSNQPNYMKVLDGLPEEYKQKLVNGDLKTSPEEELLKYGKQLKNLPIEMRETLLYGDPPGTVSTTSIGSNVLPVVGVDPAIPGKDKTVLTVIEKQDDEYSYLWEASGIPVPSSPEVEAYFTPVNQRHRYLDDIKINVSKTNIGGTSYHIEANYRGETDKGNQFKSNLICNLTLNSFESAMVMKDGEWKSTTKEKWLGTYKTQYNEWRVKVFAADNEKHFDTKDIPTMDMSSEWIMHYHHTPIEAINFIMGFNPQHPLGPIDANGYPKDKDE